MKAGISFKKKHKILGANEDEAASAGSFLCSVSLVMELHKTCFFFLPWSICALNHWRALGLGFLKEVEECGDPPAWTLLEKKAGDGWSIFSVLKSGNPVDRQRNFRAGILQGVENHLQVASCACVFCVHRPFLNFPSFEACLSALTLSSLLLLLGKHRCVSRRLWWRSGSRTSIQSTHHHHVLKNQEVFIAAVGSEGRTW